MTGATKYLNLGCGSRYHPDWINIDVNPQGPQVMQHDLTRGIPFPDASCDVVYQAAVFEHLRRPDAATHLTECCRVLKPGGIIRVGVPDLEKLCQLYLATLSAAFSGDTAAAHDYEWIMLELFDQLVRENSGGGMLDYLKQRPLPNEAFVYSRIGEEGRELVELLRTNAVHGQSHLSPRSGFRTRVLGRCRSLKKAVKARVLAGILGKEDRRAIEIGRFRLGGEVHQWMYDRYLLSRLLIQAGFRNPELQEAHTSRIPNWASFHLDTLPGGQAIKPDLFFMEASKP